MKGFGLYLIILVCLLAGVSYVVSQTQQTETLSYNQIYNYFMDGDVDQYDVDDTTLTMHLKKENQTYTYDLGDYRSVFYNDLGETIQQQMRDGTLTKVDYRTATIPWWAQFLPYVILIVLLIAFWCFMMNKQSGFLAISENTSDVRDIRDGAAAGDEKCLLALDMFIYKVVAQGAAMIASMSGVDTITFTGGIGENDWATRQAVCECFEWMGVRVDREKNKSMCSGKTGVISTAGSSVTVMVLPTDEEYMIACDVERLTK